MQFVLGTHEKRKALRVYVRNTVKDMRRPNTDLICKPSGSKLGTEPETLSVVFPHRAGVMASQLIA